MSDACRGAHGEALFAATDLLATLNEDNPELGVFGFHHVAEKLEVALFKNAQSNGHVRKEYGPQGEHRHHDHSGNKLFVFGNPEFVISAEGLPRDIPNSDDGGGKNAQTDVFAGAGRFGNGRDEGPSL